jgi:DNA-binding response OmpR family regulator
LYVDTNEKLLAGYHTKKRVLVVADEPGFAFTLHVRLENGGFVVGAFTDPELALCSFKSDSYELLLIDIMCRRWMVLFYTND